MGWLSLFNRRPAPAAKPAVQARYDSAQTTSLNQRHWSQADWYSADAGLHPGIRRTLRARARYEAANNPYLAGMLRTLAHDCIGTGPRLQLTIPGAQPEDQRLRDVEHAVHEWGRSIDLAAKLRTMRMAKAVDGEAFGRKITNLALPSDGVQLDMQLLEADQVANPTWILELGAIDGLRLDDAGNVIEWHVLRHHPGSLTWVGNQGDWVPADRILQWAHRTRPGQHRGVGEVVPALELFALLRRYTLATVTAAETAADLAAVLKTNTPMEAMNGMPAWETMPIVRGMFTSLPDGYDLGQLKPEHPTTTYDAFERRLLNQIARALNMPYIVAALDSSQASYSSMRGDYLVYRKSTAVDREDLERNVLDPLLTDWLDEAVLVGLIPRGLPPIAGWNWRWIWQPWEHVDPTKEADAQSIRLQNNTTTLADECAAVGRDWREVLKQRAAEKALCDELGLVDEPPAPARKPQEAAA